MRQLVLICSAAPFVLSACGGLLTVKVQEADGSLSASCNDSSDCDLGLVCGACGERQCCAESPGPCGPLHVNGDCPVGQTCSNGVCVDGGTKWCNCEPEQGCSGGVCVTIDSENQCSAINPNGVCRDDHVCNGGSCVPCTEKNACNAAQPSGCCPGGAVCLAGRCQSQVDESCSPTNTTGACPAGHACNEQGVCEEVACSADPFEPFGVCNPGFFCDGGTCECIPCSLDNLGGCCAEQELCSMVGYCIASDTCRVNLDCESGKFCSVTQVCLTPPACADAADCPTGQLCSGSLCTSGCNSDAECDTGYHCDGNFCAADTCASLDCAGLNRLCDEAGISAICTTCLTGYHEDTTQACVPDTCAEAGCDAVNRVCDEGGSYAVCGGCLPSFDEVDGVCSNCQLTADCNPGYYCSSAHACTQDCDPSIETTCTNGRRCSPYGRCVPEVIDAGACAAGVTEGEVVEPIVMLVVDQSGSMKWEYDDTRTGETRWGDLMDALFTVDTGVVAQLEDKIQFGMTLFTSSHSSCPALTMVPPALNNYATLSATASANSPASGTPTGETIISVVDNLKTMPNDRAKYILLATDGEPYRCEDLSKLGGHALTAYAAAYAYANDIRLFMLSVGADVADSHMQDVANAGAGCPLATFYDDVATCNLNNSTCRNKQNDVTDYTDYNPWVVKCPDDPNGVPVNHPYYKATNQEKLVNDMTSILGSVLSCVVRLNATPGAPPLSGNVYVDGEVVPPGGPDGWQITGPDTLQFLGASCTAITDGQSHFIAIDMNECDFPE